MHNTDAYSAVQQLRRLWTLLVTEDSQDQTQVMAFGPYLHEQDAIEAAERIRSAAAATGERLQVSIAPTVPPTSPLYTGAASIWYQLGLAFAEPGPQEIAG